MEVTDRASGGGGGGRRGRWCPWRVAWGWPGERGEEEEGEGGGGGEEGKGGSLPRQSGTSCAF